MSFEKLKAKVEKEMKAERQKIISDAKAKAKEIVEAAEAEARQEEEQRMKALENQLASKRTQEVASAKLEQKKQKLIARKEMLDKVFEEASNKLPKKLTQAKRKKLLGDLFKSAQKEITVAKVYCKDADAKLLDTEHKKMNMLGGFIAENKDGTISVDYRFETLLEEIRGRYLADINRILFENV
ncbi:MAG: V-type ATP synthase subunit E family protein [Candidatus Woesearchaeota archaeon]